MLAGAEEALQTGSGIEEQMTAMEAALSGLIDYAGLYPPAGLDMGAAVRNYLAYREQKHAWVLGRFIVDISRLDELRAAAGDAFSDMPLSVLASVDADLNCIAQYRANGFRIESVEVKCDEPLRIARICEFVPSGLECYFEIPISQGCSSSVDAMAAVGVRAKLRMGGVVPEAFPRAESVVARMQVLADRAVAFKATAGLHHPLRSHHRLTYATDSPTGMMHGFVNVLCAAALVRLGGTAEQVMRLLEEEAAEAFQVGVDSISAQGFRWSAAQMREVRQFFTAFGSCSFTEPIHDLEALGWL
jgi:hypothetical protein